MSEHHKLVVFIRCHILPECVADTIDSVKYHATSDPLIVVTVDRNTDIEKQLAPQYPDVLFYTSPNACGWGSGLWRLFCEAVVWLMEVKRVSFDYLANYDYDLIYTKDGADEHFLQYFDSPKVGQVGKMNLASSHWKRKTRQYLPRIMQVLNLHNKKFPVIYPIGSHCFDGDTRVPLLDGTEVSLREIEGQTVDVYSYHDGRVVPGKGVCQKTRSVDELVKVTLDNGEVVKCTLDHQWMLRDGEYIEAQHLIPGISLMPLYRRLYQKGVRAGYEQVYDPGTDGWEFTHRRVMSFSDRAWDLNEDDEIVELVRPDDFGCVHHIDFDKRNNAPDNLVWMHGHTHWRYHHLIMSERAARGETGWSAVWRHPKARENMSAQSSEKLSKTLRRLWKDPEYREQATKRNAENGRKMGAKNLVAYNMQDADSKKVLCECGQEFGNAGARGYHKKTTCTLNHRVVSVEIIRETTDTYCLTVPEYENFALSAGIFVHNCAGAFSTLKGNCVLQMYHEGYLKHPFSNIGDQVKLADDPLLSLFVQAAGYEMRHCGSEAYVEWHMKENYRTIVSRGFYVYHPTKLKPGNNKWSVANEVDCRNHFRECRGQDPIVLPPGYPVFGRPTSVQL